MIVRYPSYKAEHINCSVKITLIFSIILVTIILLKGNLKIGEYGGISSYKYLGIITLFINLLVIILGSLNKNTFKYSYIGIAYLILLFFIPQIFAKLPIFPYVYRVYGHINYIINTRHINPNYLGYQTWPGVMFLGAILEIITKLGIYILLTIPILHYFIPVPLIYSLLRKITKNISYSILGLLFFMISSYGFNWFVPGGLASLIKMTGIYILFRICYLKKNENYLKFGVILMLLTGILVFTHLLTSIFWAVTVLDFLILSTFITKSKRVKEINIVLLLLFIIFQFYWLFGHTYSVNLFKQKLNDLMGLLKAMKSVEKWTAVAQSGVTPHAKVLRIKMYFVYSVTGISLIGMLIVLAESLKRFFKTRKIDKLVFFLLLSLVSYSLTVPSIAGGYGGEIASRLFGKIRYILVIFVALALKNVKFRKIMLILLFFFVYLYLLCTYGNMALDYVESTDLVGISYSHTYIPETICSLFPTQLWKYKNIEVNEAIELLKFYKTENCRYISLSESDLRRYLFLYGQHKLEKYVYFKRNIITENYIIYTSGNFAILRGEKSDRATVLIFDKA